MYHESLKKAIEYVPKEFNLTNIALTAIFAKMRSRGEVRMTFIPITFKPRQGGKNSINVPKIIKIGIRALRDLRKINRSL